LRDSDRFLRPSALAVIALLSAGACNTRDTATPQAASSAPPEQPSVPTPEVPRVSKWELDPENSSAGFVCKHVFSNVRGMFAKPSGTVMLDEATPANSKINATIDVSSIMTGVEERDTHLKGPDFFDVAKYPAITFVSTSISKLSATSYSVMGNLTMHGVTKPVTLAVTAPPPFNHAGGIRRGIAATTSVNRKDFELRWEFPGEGAGVVVGDNIQITIDAELVLQPEPSKGG
jgi:polyisoprenoid-binding protein YceI